MEGCTNFFYHVALDGADVEVVFECSVGCFAAFAAYHNYGGIVFLCLSVQERGGAGEAHFGNYRTVIRYFLPVGAVGMAVVQGRLRAVVCPVEVLDVFVYFESCVFQPFVDVDNVFLVYVRRACAAADRLVGPSAEQRYGRAVCEG